MSEDEKHGLTRRGFITLGGAATAGTLLAHGSEAGAEEKPKEKDAPLPQVPRRKLGKTNETVPILLMGGSMRFDQRFDPKMAECLRFGVNYFDMADCYAGGTSETAMGNFHTRLKNRDELWITSKSDEHDPAGFVKTVEQSLTKMKTSYVNLYFLHNLTDPEYLSTELAKTVEGLKKAGKIRHFGFSCHGSNVADLLKRASKISWVDAIMFRYNFRQYGNKELNDAMDAAHKANIGLIAMKTQGSEASFEKSWKKFEQTGKWNKFQAVMKGVWEDQRISAAVSQMDTFEKLKQNVAAAVDKSELTQLERESIEKYASATRNLACDGCDHLCNPTVNAPVQIGATMRYLMYHDVYGQDDLARELFDRLPAEARAIDRVDFQPASRACPNGLDVAHHMARAAKLFLA